MVAHSCHSKTKNLSAKTKTSRQNQKPDCKTEGTSQIVGLEFFAMKLKVTKPFGIISPLILVAGGPLDFK